MSEQAPNPGSREAIVLGCKCPVLDNAHGAGMPYPDGPRWWINGECPLHGAPDEQKGVDDEQTGT